MRTASPVAPQRHVAGLVALEVGDEDRVRLQPGDGRPVVPRLLRAEGLPGEAEELALVLDRVRPDRRLPVRHRNRL